MDGNANLKIFLVDDDAFCRNVYQQHLNNLGYHDISCFENGADCLDHLSQRPDVIFLDHGMDKLTGLEVLKKIKQINPDIFVVFLSGKANIITAVKALKIGAFEYIVKGVNEFENMTKVITTIAGIKQAG